MDTVPCVSNVKSEPVDKDYTALCAIIENYKVFGSEDDLKHRIEVLNEIQEIGLKLGVKIQTIFSLQMNVLFPAFDIDAVCFAPRGTEDDFLEKRFPEELKKCGKFSEYQLVEDIYIPIIEITFDNVKVRLSFGRLKSDVIPENVPCTLWDLDGSLYHLLCDESFKRNANVTDANVKLYALVLRAVKLWAKQRSIYSPSYQTLAGLHWEMHVAVAIFPRRRKWGIIRSVGDCYNSFLRRKYPTVHAIRKSTLNLSELKFRMGPPKIYSEDPNFPEIKKRFLVHEFRRAARLIKDISREKTTWHTLFHEPNFFYEYENFLVLLEWSPTEETNLKWRKLIASKLHHLIDNFDSNKRIKLSHVNPNHFERQRLSRIDRQFDAKPFCSMWFIAIERRYQTIGYQQLIQQDIKAFEKELLRPPSARQAICKDGIEIEVRHIKRNRLRFYLNKSYLESLRRKLESQLPWCRETRDFSTSSEVSVDERLYLSNYHTPTPTSNASMLSPVVIATPET